ncbi:MAG TPA: hypothetical protein VKR06_15605 [Ktedonosporobacter sp.]|nr:hypothetical protein [Ktedonosporobacter sp.]
MTNTPPPQQPYDVSLKGVFEENVTRIVPRIVPGMRIERELTVEMIRPALRGDKVYLAWYRDRWHILHVEFESSDNVHMPMRLLTYHSILHEDYYDEFAHYPVISIIVYPFKVNHLPTSPYVEMSGDEVLLVFHFRVVPLYEMDPYPYLQEHVVSMYALLPTMKGVTKELLLKAIDEMVTVYKGDDVQLKRHLRWMGILLRRSTTAADDVKEEVQRRIKMLDHLWEEDPVMKNWRQGGVEEGREEGLLQGKRWDILRVVQLRFPGILQTVQEWTEQVTDLNQLGELFDQLVVAPDEATALSILNKQVEL